MKKIRRYLPLYLLAAPGILYLLINNYLPMAGIFIAFKRLDFSKGIFKSDWVGLENFEFLFKTSDAWVITRNTILYNVLFIVLSTVGAIVIAIFLNEIGKKFFQRFYQTIILIPSLVSMVIVAYLVYAFLSPTGGYINSIIFKLFGMDPVNWYDKAMAWPIILPIVYLWKNVGQLSVIYFSSIIGIDHEYYEAAELDGATAWNKVTQITLPLIKPIIVTMILFSVGRIFYSDFGLFYQVTMNSGTIYSTTNTIDTYVFRGLMQYGDMAMSSAAGLYQSVVGFILVLLSNFIVKKIDAENALF